MLQRIINNIKRRAARRGQRCIAIFTNITLVLIGHPVSIGLAYKRTATGGLPALTFHGRMSQSGRSETNVLLQTRHSARQAREHRHPASHDQLLPETTGGFVATPNDIIDIVPRDIEDAATYRPRTQGRTDKQDELQHP
jgi:hypothetical protein